MKPGKLLLIGFSNWDYYLEEGGTSVLAIAKKGSGASNCTFGTPEYFKNWLLAELSRNDKYETRLTAAGFRMIPDYQIQ